ncbi:MAG: recombination protein RecR, partial [Nitrospirae bacterium]|nr:recombination protein RecR [Nitrospirota bacterium]
MGNTEALDRVIEELRRLPGVGRKTAQRLALYLLSAEEGAVRRLAQALVD